MKKDQKNSYESETYLEFAHCTPFKNDIDTKHTMHVQLSGNSLALANALKQIKKAAEEENLEMKDSLVPAPFSITKLKDPRYPPTIGKNDKLLDLKFLNLDTDDTAERMLGIIHRATDCNLSAYVAANVTESRAQHPDKGDPPLSYIPSADINIYHPDPATRKIISGYLRDNLDNMYEDKFTLGNSGHIGLPHECFNDGGLKQHQNQHEKIFLTFHDRETFDKEEAHRIAAAAAEHVNNMLRIPERFSGPGLNGHNHHSWHRRN